MSIKDSSSKSKNLVSERHRLRTKGSVSTTRQEGASLTGILRVVQCFLHSKEVEESPECAWITSEPRFASLTPHPGWRFWKPGIWKLKEREEEHSHGMKQAAGKRED